jgi:hypothetical protein
MPSRPSIPAHITREILIESGHRCTVCGASCPLERAHIIPWHKSKDHKAEDLICLCASCHERADLEQWGETTLREYKRRPWILRQDIKLSAVTRLRLTIDMELDQFDDSQQRFLKYAIAGFLGISPETVKIVSAEEANSINVVIELPRRYAAQLLHRSKSANTLLAEYLLPMSLLKIEMAKQGKKTPRGTKRRKFRRDQDIYIPATAAARILSVSVGTIRLWTRLGVLPGFKRQGAWLYRKQDIEQYFKKMQVEHREAGHLQN